MHSSLISLRYNFVSASFSFCLFSCEHLQLLIVSLLHFPAAWVASFLLRHLPVRLYVRQSMVPTNCTDSGLSHENAGHYSSRPAITNVLSQRKSAHVHSSRDVFSFASLTLVLSRPTLHRITSFQSQAAMTSLVVVDDASLVVMVIL